MLKIMNTEINNLWSSEATDVENESISNEEDNHFNDDEKQAYSLHQKVNSKLEEHPRTFIDYMAYTIDSPAWRIPKRIIQIDFDGSINDENKIENIWKKRARKTWKKFHVDFEYILFSRQEALDVVRLQYPNLH